MSAHTLAIRKSRAAPNLHDFLDVLGGELPLHLQRRSRRCCLLRPLQLQRRLPLLR